MTGRGPIALFGYGRFGQAFHTLLRARTPERELRVVDPGAAVPADVVAASVEGAIQGAEVIVLAVPVGAMRALCEEVAPLLDESHLVLDVGSVKVEPERILSDMLGVRVPWAATHPLFGPGSLSSSPALKAIVCPNPHHPAAPERARALFEALGCRVHLLDAESHDRLMAETQAVAFFLGAGLRDAGLGDDQTWGPPSAEALARLAGGVTKEGGHLRTTILADNPHAGPVRARLLSSLEALDRSLRDDLGEGLTELRGRIDDVDARLLDLLRERAEIALRISRAKAALGRAVQDAAREGAAFDDRRRWARDRGLDEDFVTELFEAVLVWSRELQEQDRRR